MTNKHLIYMMLIFLLLFSACERIDIGKSFDCKVGERYIVNSRLSFSIDSVIDYTCPKDMLCIWSGDVDLYFDIIYKSTQVDTLIYFLTRGRNPFVLYGYTWEVLEVNPLGDYINNPVEQKDYTINMILQEN